MTTTEAPPKMATSILCPSGHRHVLPLYEGSCWASEGEPQRVGVTYAEHRVAQELLRDGASNRMIGARLHITEDTVKSHMKKLFARSGARNRDELIVSVFRGRVRLIPQPIAATVYWNGTDDAPLAQ